MIKVNKVFKNIIIDSQVILDTKKGQKTAPIIITINQDTPISSDENGNLIVFKKGQQFIITEKYENVSNSLLDIL